MSVTYFANSSIESDVDDEQKDPPMTTPTTTTQIPEVASTSSITYRPHQKLSRGEDINKFPHEFQMVKESKFVCSLALLLQIFQARCQTPGCVNAPTVSYRLVCASLLVDSVCSSGHKHRFCSSHELGEGVYANSLQAAASILLSGNNFAKIERMANFYGLAFLSKSTFYRYQRLYLIPEINEWWTWTREELLKEFVGQDIILSGDGQCDSPGFNAKNLCYFMVEANSNYIIDVEILDKRHVGLASTNMEREAVKRGLERLTQEIKVVEFVTDASTSVKALLGMYNTQ
jgi:hypothetical protein